MFDQILDCNKVGTGYAGKKELWASLCAIFAALISWNSGDLMSAFEDVLSS